MDNENSVNSTKHVIHTAEPKRRGSRHGRNMMKMQIKLWKYWNSGNTENQLICQKRESKSSSNDSGY